MKIVGIEFTNFKGMSGKIELSGKDLITGNHGAGKSRVEQAIQFALTGKIAEFRSSTNDNLFKMSSVQDANSKPMVGARLIFDTGFEFERMIQKYVTKKADGSRPISYKQHLNCKPLIDESTQKDFEKRLIKEIDPQEIMFSISSFYDMSAQEKKRYIMRLSNFNYDAWNAESIRSYLEQDMLTSTLLSNDEKMYNDYKKAIDDLVGQYSEKLSFEDNCTALHSIAKSEESTAKENKSKAVAATQKLTEIKNRTTTTIRGIEENKKTLANEEDHLIELNKLQVQNNNNIEFNQNLKNDIQRVENELEEAKSATNPYVLEELQSSLDALDLELPMQKHAERPEELGKLAKEIEEKQDVITQLKKKIDLIIEDGQKKKADYEDLVGEYNHFSEHIQLLSGDIVALESNIKKLTTGECPLMKGIKCTTDFSPMIKSFEDNIVLKKNRIKELSDDQVEFETTVHEARSEYNKSVQEYEDVESNIQDEYKALESLEQKVESIAIEVGQENDRLKSEYDESLAAYRISLSNKDDLTKKIQECKEFDSVQQAKVNNIDEALSLLVDIKEKPVESVEPLKDQIEVTNKVISDLKVKIKEQEDALRNLQNQQESIVDVKQAENFYLAYSKLKKLTGVEGIQGEVLKQGLEPMRSSINDHLQLLGKDVEFYFDTSGTGKKAVFDYGWIDKGTNIKKSIDALSRGETLILTTAMIVTFTQTIDDIKYTCYLIDNLNDLDADAIALFLKGMKQIAANNIVVAGIINDRIGNENELESFKIHRI